MPVMPGALADMARIIFSSRNEMVNVWITGQWQQANDLQRACDLNRCDGQMA